MTEHIRDPATAQWLIREAGRHDAGAVADLHIESWRATYAGILPETYLQHDIVAERRSFWQNALCAPAPGDLVLLMLRDGGLIAFAAVLADHEPDCDAYIDNLHVHPENKGLGLGTAMMGVLAERLVNAGARSACLWVFDDNHAAMDFYLRLGGVADQHGFDDFAGGRAAHTRIVWRDLGVLSNACRR